MIIDTSLLQEKCKKILDAIGNKKGIAVDTLELKTEDGNLNLSVTDKEYFLSVQVPVDTTEELHAVVVATVFLKLVATTTTKTISLKVTDNILHIKGNGNYKLPLIVDNRTGELAKLNKITINNVTSQFTIKNSILQSIQKYNAKIFSTGEGQSQFPFLYVDEQGAITIVRSACVNSFTLEKPVSLFLTETLVKLFKLFKSEDILFTLGFDELPNGILQQKVSFATEGVVLNAILTTSLQITNNFPVAKIRDIANTASPHTAIVSKDSLVGALTRLSLFKSTNPKYENVIRFTFGVDGVKIEDYGQVNSETVYYSNACETLVGVPEYEAAFNIKDVSLILDSCDDEFLTLSFGQKALYITKANIKNIIPELKRGN